MSNLDDTSLILKVNLLPNSKTAFLNWQSNFRSQISQAQGFKSLEILSPFPYQSNMWILNLRFISKEDLDLWLKSKPYEQLLKELTDYHITDSPYVISKEKPTHYQGGVTEIYFMLIKPENLLKFHQWFEKIHKIEATFPGFQKIYIQAPNLQEKEEAWITLLQFDTLANLERWHNSSKRLEILKESQSFMTSKEIHRLLATFGGWFDDKSLARNPPKWKQGMLILAVLFPIVMLQYLYLAPQLNFMTLSFKTFIQNVISVTLMTWPLLPLAIYGLKWWLELKSNPAKQLLGIGILLLIYGLEMALFWKLSIS